MKAAFLKAPFQVRFEDVPVPQPGPGEVLLAITRVGLCGTDIHGAKAWATDWQRFGHEQVGIIAEIGAGVSDLDKGDVVVVQASSPCGVCASCMDGRPLECLDWKKSRSLEGLAEFVVVHRRYAWKVEEIGPEEAVLIEPLAVSLDCIRLAEIDLHHTVALVGPGPIGMMTIPLARLRGARRIFVVGLDADVSRFDVCRELGADACINASRTNPVTAIRELTDGRGVDRVINTATPSSIPSSLDMSADGGITVFVGFALTESDATVPLNLNDLHRRRLQIRGSYMAPATKFPLANQLLRDRVFPVDKLITHHFPFGELDTALRVLSVHGDGVIKAVVNVAT